MNKKLIFFLILSHLCSYADVKPRYKVGLLVMATGKYTYFLDKLFVSADQFFLSNHDCTYFVFTDGQVPESDHVVRIEQKRLGWPYDTMMRFKVYYDSSAQFKDFDYLFACDADMLFIDTVGDEILGDRVATQHPGFSLPYQRHDDYERNRASTACVYENEGHYYFAGGFYGGSTQEFLQMAYNCAQNITIDLSHNIIAQWHDESHLNRYFIDYPPTVILSPSYCYPDLWDLPFDRKLLALTKNHAEFRAN